MQPAYWGWACDALRCRARDADVGLLMGVWACKRLGLSRMALKSRCAVCAYGWWCTNAISYTSSEGRGGLAGWRSCQ